VEASGAHVADGGFNALPHSGRAIIAHARTDLGVLRGLGFGARAVNIDKLASKFDKG
jgi:hypothetical protein